ncbi:MAG TPA: transaldolase family protein [Ktedonobacterales bacterium]|jgi:TalC/MipB family fructose-6-phosphate aldolase
MGLYVDSAVLAEVASLNERFPLAGATTNPSIMLAALTAGQRLDDLTILRELAALEFPTVMAQPNGESEDDLYAAAMRYVAVAPARMVTKLLLTPQGLRVGMRLRQQGARVAFTCVSTAEQAYCASAAGADWVIPYVGRLRRAGADPCERIARMARLIRGTGSGTRILAASIKHASDVVEATLVGADDVTASAPVIASLLADPLTEAAATQFAEDWQRFQAGTRAG